MQGIDDDFRENLPSVVITQSSRPYHNGAKQILKPNLKTILINTIDIDKSLVFDNSKIIE